MQPVDVSKLKFGYYLVGDEIITNKVKALRRATETGIGPSWHFHNSVYSNLNWQNPLDIELSVLYQMRARQLREKYDYVVINFSGGSDSWTVLKAFYDCNIYPDEIFIRWPIQATRGKFSVDAHNKHPSNILSEWDLTIIPALNEIKSWFPKTLITIHDWSDEFFTARINDDLWLEKMPEDYLNPGAIPKFSAIGDNEKKHIQSGKKTAVVDGIDKPQLWYIEGKVYCYFLDKLVNAHAPEVDGRNAEHFYWTPDLPEITVAQSQKIFQALKNAPHYLSLIDRTIPYDPSKKNIWNTFTRQIIYSEYVAKNFFQSNKSYTSIYDEVDQWMFADGYKDFYFLQSWKNVLENIVNSIDIKYFDKKNNELLGYCGFFDQLYLVGEIPV